MKANVGTREGFQTVAYPKHRKSRKSLTYLHIHTAPGRVFLLFALYIGEQMLGHTTECMFSRKFYKSGFNKIRLLAELNRRLPDYAAFYEPLAERELTPNIAYHRFHKKYGYTNGPKGKGGTPAQSREYYTASRWLRPLHPAVEQVFREGPEILRLNDMMRIGAMP